MILSYDDLKADMLEWGRVMSPIREDWQRYQNTPQQWGVIRRAYAYMMPKIMANYRTSPYFLDWFHVMTPIESDLWQSIRCLCLPFFPQFPVGRYFVDFADPKRKLALECDGKAWHNAEKDAERDAELGELGWTVIRFSGRRCFMGEDNPESAHVELEELAQIYHEESRALCEQEEML